MKNILSYGALYEENATLKKNIKKLKSTCYWLLKEMKIQHRVIDQLKLLYDSKSSVSLKSTYTSKNYCDQGHYKCEILHRRFNLVNVSISSSLTINTTSVPTRSILAGIQTTKANKIFFRNGGNGCCTLF